MQIEKVERRAFGVRRSRPHESLRQRIPLANKVFITNWATNPLNIAIRIKTNMNRGGFVKNFYVDTVTPPNGVNLKGGGYGSAFLSGSPINGTVPVGVVTATAGNPSASQGGLITFDCDYQPANDANRTRPAVIQNVNISNVQGTRKRDDARADPCLQRQWNHVEKRDHRFDDLQHDGRRSALSGR
ncbi:MAG: hypothetical protein QOC89_1334 [Paraburkholderia sp.]|nr:hypothetical protein [Paraburkholderia sp.]